MNILIEISSWIFLSAGSFFCISGGVGVLRFPDFYTRMHASGVTDTLGAGLLIAGLMLQTTEVLVLLKLILVLLFTLLTCPAASHALAKAAVRGKLAPVLSRRE